MEILTIIKTRAISSFGNFYNNISFSFKRKQPRLKGHLLLSIGFSRLAEVEVVVLCSNFVQPCFLCGTNFATLVFIGIDLPASSGLTGLKQIQNQVLSKSFWVRTFQTLFSSSIRLKSHTFFKGYQTLYHLTQ